MFSSIDSTMADPEVVTLGVIDIQCRPHAKKKQKQTNKQTNKQNNNNNNKISQILHAFACLFSLPGLFHAILYVHAHAHLSIMMGSAKS